MLAVGICLVTLIALCLVGFPVRAGLRRCHLPPAASLMLLGALVGAEGFDLLPTQWTSHAPSLSIAAFMLLLLRAGMGLEFKTIRTILLPSLVLGTLPVVAEAAAFAGLARASLFDDWNVCLLAGVLVAAVSPAVILPTMLAQKDRGRGAERLVPDRIMGQMIVNAFLAQAGILFLVDLIAPISGDSPTGRLMSLPLGLLGGVAVGVAAGWLLRVDVLLARATRSERLPTLFAALLAFAGTLGVYALCTAANLETVFAALAVGIVLRRRLGGREAALRSELRRLWSVAEIVLFVNLGSLIRLDTLSAAGTVPLLLGLLVAALAVRLVVAHTLSRGTVLTTTERWYNTFSHVPKATIQAVYGAYPLVMFRERAMGPDLIADAETMLVLAAVAIIATAPLGAILLDRLGARWLPRV